MRNATWKWCQRPLAGCARQGGRPKNISLRLYFRFVFTSVFTWVEIEAKVGQRILQSVRRRVGIDLTVRHQPLTHRGPRGETMNVKTSNEGLSRRLGRYSVAVAGGALLPAGAFAAPVAIDAGALLSISVDNSSDSETIDLDGDGTDDFSVSCRSIRQ
jgi:hypothetical protein